MAYGLCGRLTWSVYRSVDCTLALDLLFIAYDILRMRTRHVTSSMHRKNVHVPLDVKDQRVDRRAPSLAANTLRKLEAFQSVESVTPLNRLVSSIVKDRQESTSLMLWR